MLKYADITKETGRALTYFQDKLAFTLGPVELKKAMELENVQIIDVRKSEDFQKSHIPHAISIPGNELESSLHKLSKNNINIVYCYTQQCHLGAKAAAILAENHYPVMELEGGFDAWKNIYDFEVVSL